jgi:hypothetical protein
MKQLTILSTVYLCLLMAFSKASAQSMETNSPMKDSSPVATIHPLQTLSDSIAADRYNKNKSNMTILAAWAGVNIIQGSISATNATGSGPYFFRMNAYWNVVNLGIATFGLIKLRKTYNKPYSIVQNHLEQQQLEKILLLNSGLDLAYIATGFLLKESGQRRNNLTSTGYGNSLLLQGAFLLVFDLVQYGNHRRNGKLLEGALSKLQIQASGNGIGLRLPL